MRPCRGAACAGHRCSGHRGGRRALRGVRAPPALHGDVGFHVRAARDAHGGALRRIVIPPGAPWRFHVAVGDPSGIPLRVIGGGRASPPPRRTPGVGCAAVAVAAARYAEGIRIIFECPPRRKAGGQRRTT